MTFDEELSKAARSLHREWPAPGLWPAIAAEIAAAERAERNARVRRRAWTALTAAAAVILVVAASLLVMRERVTRVNPAIPAVARGGERLLSDEALAEVERAERQYIAAIESLAAKVIQSGDAASSPVLANLRERLLVIDAAIADCRAQIERNRFNAHLRRQLLSVYQEKRRTLEQILQQEHHVS
jgi:hypothetical protein